MSDKPTSQLVALVNIEQQMALDTVARRLRTATLTLPTSDDVRTMLRNEIVRQRRAFRVFLALIVAPLPDHCDLDEAPRPLTPDAPDEPNEDPKTGQGSTS